MSAIVSLHDRRPGRVPVPPLHDLATWNGERAVHRRVRRKHMLFRAGQPANAAYLVHAGVFKCTVLDAHGRERVTGFALKGDVLGVESLSSPLYVSDVMALDIGDVIELPRSELLDPVRGALPVVAAGMSAAFERDWSWMLALHSLDAEQRVARFLLDYADRLARWGYGTDRVSLRMTRADIGSFLDMAPESVVRALTRLEGAGLIRVACRDIALLDRVALERLLAPADDARLTPAAAPARLH